MKRFMNNILVAGALMIGARGLVAAQTGENFVDQFYKAKLGRTHFAEARQRAEETNTVYREEASPAVKPANTWFADYYNAKFGTNPPAEEARLRAERANTAFREEATTKAVPANTWHRDHCTAKFGATYPGYMGK